ncbi:CPBP family intramembrane glutamic endopeptidase [Streptobacillus ratti]|uniref:CPBP family intramembrane glutamic endopeptidase n=1 Tax=Streptobacillus ratti TaxID=1720557 RepID=UPI000934FE15|nr:CPBP family intramembrane glutamic endopeptidase [Streptobacillus ratti]
MIKDFSVKYKIVLFISVLLGILATEIVVGFIEGVVAAIKNREISQYNITFISSIISIFVIYFIFKKFKIKIFEEDKLTLTKAISVIIATIILSKVIGFIRIYFSVNPNNQKQLENIIVHKNYISIILGIGIIIPIFEEIVFRRIIYNLFKNRYVGFIVSVCLFSLAHGPKTIFEFGIYAMLGSIFTGIYFITGSLKLAILSHMINNLMFVVGYLAK